ncbi:hypothetical protein K1T71_015128 [Dendrolimus kikuchii]|nr:hypothetical protein K1T71_015128 [Dendrolimus kikuchii]
MKARRHTPAHTAHSNTTKARAKRRVHWAVGGGGFARERSGGVSSLSRPVVYFFAAEGLSSRPPSTWGVAAAAFFGLGAFGFLVGGFAVFLAFGAAPLALRGGRRSSSTRRRAGFFLAAAAFLSLVAAEPAAFDLDGEAADAEAAAPFFPFAGRQRGATFFDLPEDAVPVSSPSAAALPADPLLGSGGRFLRRGRLGFQLERSRCALAFGLDQRTPIRRRS